MDYRKFDDTWIVRLDRGEFVHPCLTALCEKEHILLGQISAIGAIDHAVIGVYDLEHGAYVQRTYDEFMEISNLSGSVTEKDGKPYLHLHVTTCGQDLSVHAGHAIELRVGATCELFLRVFDGRIERRPDPGTGLNLFGF